MEVSKGNWLPIREKGDKVLLMERSDIIAIRHMYLRKLAKFRIEGREIIYLDEPWVNVEHATAAARYTARGGPRYGRNKKFVIDNTVQSRL